MESMSRVKNQLKKGDSYCCLGVLCEVMGEEYDGLDSGPSAEILDKAETNRYSDFCSCTS